ncbi:MAG: glycosyltransferase [Limnochordaceae bacterium]|nr:glycosyltransferase [Limnochordaceae bacterium]
MRVALAALSVRGAMGQYLGALLPPLSELVDVHLFVPEHYQECAGRAAVHRFKTGRNHAEALASLMNPYGALRIWKEIREMRPDVVHLFNGEGYPWSLLWARWAHRDGIPLLVTLHDPEPHPGSIWDNLNGRLRRAVLTHAESVHVHVPSFCDAAMQEGARRVRVIRHGSLAHRFLRYKRPTVGREPLVVSFGRLEPYKGLEVLVEAGFLLDGAMRVAIAGPGRLPRKVRERVMRNPDIFEVHERYLDDWEVAELFQRAAVCALPYVQVTQSSVPLIAAAFGVPVVASALGGFLDDVPAVNGVLVPPGDAEALAKGIKMAVGLRPTYPAEREFSRLAVAFEQWYSAHVRR